MRGCQKAFSPIAITRRFGVTWTRGKENAFRSGGAHRWSSPGALGAAPARPAARAHGSRPLRFRDERDSALVPSRDHRGDHRHRRDPGRGQRCAVVAGARGSAARAELPEPHPLHPQLHDRRARHRRRPAQRPRRSPAEPVDRLSHAGELLHRADQGRARCRERRAHAAAGHPPAAVGDHGDGRGDLDDRDRCATVPSRVRARRSDRHRHPLRNAQSVEGAQRGLPTRGRDALGSRRRDGLTDSRHPRSRPRADRRHAREQRCRRRAPRGPAPRHAERARRVDLVGRDAVAGGRMPRPGRDLLAHRHPPHHSRRGRAALHVLHAAHRWAHRSC